MAATAELGLRTQEKNTYPDWNKWIKTVNPHRPLEFFTNYCRFGKEISSDDFQERLDKIGAQLGIASKSDVIVDQWVAICKTPLKKRTITEETIDKVRSLLVTDEAARLLTRIKTEFVVLWALLNRGEFREHRAGLESNKIALLKERFSRERLDQVAWSFFNEGFYYVALQFYRALQEKEDAPFVKSQIGRCHHLLGCPGKALEYFEKVRIQPDGLTTFSVQEGNFLHLINFGDAYFDLHDSENAIEKYEEALEQLQAYRNTLRSVRGKEDPIKEADAFISLAALLLIRALDNESERKERSIKFELDAYWLDAEGFHEWADRFPTTELRYRFFTAYKECGPFLDAFVGSSFMEYDARKTKKLFPFKEAHPAAIRPLFRFFPDFYSDQSERLLVLISNFFASHPKIAKIHRRNGEGETDPIAQQKHYKKALRAAKDHLRSQERENVIDQINAISKLGDMYAFLGRENRSLEKTVKAWSSYKDALDLAYKKKFRIEGAKEQLSEIQDQSERLARGEVNPSYRLARKLIKAERYPESALYFMKALKDFTPQKDASEDDSDETSIYDDCKGWLEASLKRISPPHHKETLETLKQLEKLLEEFGDDDLMQLLQEVL